jgi:hypothetical protein
MNVNILKALSVPGLIPDAKIAQLVSFQPRLANLISDLCIGANGLSAPVLRLGGIDLRGENSNSGVVVLSTPSGNPLANVYQVGDPPFGNDPATWGVESYYTHLLERGQNRNSIESVRIPYVVNKVRAKIPTLVAAADKRNVDMFCSVVDQMLGSLRSGLNTTTDVTLKVKEVYAVMQSILDGTLVDTTLVQHMHKTCAKIIDSKQHVFDRVKNEFVLRKFWHVTAHGDYGFNVKKVYVTPTTDTVDHVTEKVAANSFGTRDFIRNRMTIEDKGFFKSFAHMATVAPDLHAALYVQMVLTKQTNMATTTGRHMYTSWPVSTASSMFGGGEMLTGAPDYLELMPNGDAYDANAACASWTYSQTNTKTSAHALFECVE